MFFTILLVTGNTMAQAVRERTGELGVLKAIGFTNAQVVALVLAESCLLTVLGGMVGLGLALRHHASHCPDRWQDCCRMFFLPTRDLFIGFGLSVALGSGHGDFSRTPGHAPARGRCPEENVKMKMTDQHRTFNIQRRISRQVESA